MALTEPRFDTRPQDLGAPDEPDAGRSAQREHQDKAITRASRKAWISQLLRSMRLSNVRPAPSRNRTDGRSGFRCDGPIHDDA